MLLESRALFFVFRHSLRYDELTNRQALLIYDLIARSASTG